MTSYELPELPAGPVRLPDEHPLIGDQRPRILTAPYSTSSAGMETIELARKAGLVLDDWQQFVLNVGMAEGIDGLWAALEIALILSRQNGKGSIIEARQLAGLFLLEEEVQIYTAHEFKTAKNQMRRIVTLIDGHPDFKRRVKDVKYSHGEEGIELKNGQRLLFMARTEGSGRGFSGDTVYLDEAMILDADSVAALLPTLSARPNPQIWYLGSAGIGAKSEQLGDVRRRGLAGSDGLAFMEWSAELCNERCKRGCRKHDRRDDPRTWAKANPALGIRITVGFVKRELDAMKTEKFNQERLGVGDYPAATEKWTEISRPAWEKQHAPGSRPLDPVIVSADIPPERTSGAIGIAGYREDGHRHIEHVDQRDGIGWMVDRIAEVCTRSTVYVVVIDAAGPAGQLVAPLKKKFAKLKKRGELKHDIEIVTPSTREVGAAFGGFVTAVTDSHNVWHLNQAPINTALAGAQARDVGDQKMWARKNATVDISPLVAVTNALWGLENYGDVTPTEEVIEGDLMA